MEFGEILSEKNRYAFTDAIHYISVRSIEYEYNIVCQPRSRKPNGVIFGSFLSRESSLGYPTIGLVYNFIMLNPKKLPMTIAERHDRMDQLINIDIDTKITYLIRVDKLKDTTSIHPILAIMFATTISQQFATEVIGHISGLRLAGCDPNTNIGSLWEEQNEREISIAEYKRSASLCSLLVDELRGEISNLKVEILEMARKNSELRTENKELRAIASEHQSNRKSRTSRICGWFVHLGRSSKIEPAEFQSM
jgi:hypothetical protein